MVPTRLLGRGTGDSRINTLRWLVAILVRDAGSFELETTESALHIRAATEPLATRIAGGLRMLERDPGWLETCGWSTPLHHGIEWARTHAATFYEQLTRSQRWGEFLENMEEGSTDATAPELPPEPTPPPTDTSDQVTTLAKALRKKPPTDFEPELRKLPSTALQAQVAAEYLRLTHPRYRGGKALRRVLTYLSAPHLGDEAEAGVARLEACLLSTNIRLGLRVIEKYVRWTPSGSATRAVGRFIREIIRLRPPLTLFQAYKALIRSTDTRLAADVLTHYHREFVDTLVPEYQELLAREALRLRRKHVDYLLLADGLHVVDATKGREIANTTVAECADDPEFDMVGSAPLLLRLLPMTDSFVRRQLLRRVTWSTQWVGAVTQAELVDRIMDSSLDDRIRLSLLAAMMDRAIRERNPVLVERVLGTCPGDQGLGIWQYGLPALDPTLERTRAHAPWAMPVAANDTRIVSDPRLIALLRQSERTHELPTALRYALEAWRIQRGIELAEVVEAIGQRFFALQEPERLTFEEANERLGRGPETFEVALATLPHLSMNSRTELYARALARLGDDPRFANAAAKLTREIQFTGVRSVGFWNVILRSLGEKSDPRAEEVLRTVIEPWIADSFAGEAQTKMARYAKRCAEQVARIPPPSALGPRAARIVKELHARYVTTSE